MREDSFVRQLSGLLAAAVILTAAVLFSGCSTSPVEKRQGKVYSCVINLLGQEVEAAIAEVVCTNIYTRRRVSVSK